MIAFFRAQAAHDTKLIRHRPQLWQMLAESQPRNLRRHLLELPAVGMARLHVERIGLRWPARHPQQDALPPPLLIVRQLISQNRKPAAGARAEKAKRGGMKKAAASEA